MKRLSGFILVFVIVMLTACGTKTEAVSESVEKVVDAMFTAPNEKLYSKEALTMIGGGVENNMQNVFDTSDEIASNWQEEVGEHFAEGALKTFLNNGPGFMYLAEASRDDVEMSVKSVSLEEKGDTFEKVNVVYTKGDTEEKAVILFKVDDKRLITKVEVLVEK